MRPLSSASVALLLLAATGCGSGDGADIDRAATTTAPPAGSPGPVASPGCGADDVVGAGRERVTLTSGGQERWFYRDVPPAHDGTEPVPVVLDFHGYSEGADVHLAMTGLAPFGAEQGFVTITPQGRGEIPAWDARLDSADVAFVGDLLDSVEQTLCVDTAAVYATGLSNGAFLTSALACEYADRIAAVAPVAGIRDVDDCEPSRPVPVLTIHGTADTYVTYDGALGEGAANLPARDGSGRTLGETGEVNPDERGPSIPEITGSWVARNGCDGGPTEEAVADDVVVLRFDCPEGAEVVLYRVDEGGHTWPGSDLGAAVADIVGRTTTSIEANEVIWDFFQEHSLPADAG